MPLPPFPCCSFVGPLTVEHSFCLTKDSNFSPSWTASLLELSTTLQVDPQFKVAYMACVYVCQAIITEPYRSTTPGSLLFSWWACGSTFSQLVMLMQKHGGSLDEFPLDKLIFVNWHCALCGLFLHMKTYMKMCDPLCSTNCKEYIRQNVNNFFAEVHLQCSISMIVNPRDIKTDIGVFKMSTVTKKLLCRSS